MSTFRDAPTPRTPTAELRRLIRERMERQAGRISFEQLRDIGLSRQQIDRRRRSGEFILESVPRRRRRAAGPDAAPALTRRVYRSPGAPMTPLGATWSALLSAPGESFVDHVSSLQMRGLELPSSPIHIVTVGGGWEAPAGVIAHRTRSLPDADRFVVDHVPCTSVARALIAAAPDITTTRLNDLLDTAVRMKFYDGDEMVRILESRQTVRGFAPLTQAVAELDATSGTFRSIFERRTMRLMERSTVIPPAVVNELLEGYRPDLHLPGTRVIIECDGRDYHRSPAQIIADDQRQQILEALGYRFLRLRWADVVYDEERTLARIERFVRENNVPPVPGR